MVVLGEVLGFGWEGGGCAEGEVGFGRCCGRQGEEVGVLGAARVRVDVLDLLAWVM